MITSFLIFILSFVIFLFAPDTYDFKYCLIVFFIFLFSSFITIRKTVRIENNYFIFPVLFSLSFLFVNFVYPVFLYPYNPDYFSVFSRFTFNSNFISICTALASLGYSAYSLGIFFYYKDTKLLYVKEDSDYSLLSESKYFNYAIKLSSFIFILLVLMIFFIARDDILVRDFHAFSNIPPSILVLAQVFLSIIIILSFAENKKKGFTSFRSILFKNKVLMLLLIFYILLFLYVGDRGPAIQTVLMLIFAYTIFIKPLKLKHIIPLVISGMFVLTIISYSRLSSGSFLETARDTEITSFADIGMDLIVNNRNLYVGYEIVEEKGLNYGKSMFHYALAPIPYLPTIASEWLFNESPYQLSTASIITEYSNAHYGLGTNVIIDLYMQFGTIGVVIFMFLFGWFITKSQVKYKEMHINYLFVLAFFMSYSIYIPRSSLFDSIRFIVWTIFFYKLILGIAKINSKFLKGY